MEEIPGIAQERTMRSDLQRILEQKKAHRTRAAKAPLPEKLAKLDVLRERQVAIRSAKRASKAPASQKPQGKSTRP